MTGILTIFKSIRYSQRIFLVILSDKNLQRAFTKKKEIADSPTFLLRVSFGFATVDANKLWANKLYFRKQIRKATIKNSISCFVEEIPSKRSADPGQCRSKPLLKQVAVEVLGNVLLILNIKKYILIQNNFCHNSFKLILFLLSYCYIKTDWQTSLLKCMNIFHIR